MKVVIGFIEMVKVHISNMYSFGIRRTNYTSFKATALLTIIRWT